MNTVKVRYIVDDVDAAKTFYCERLGFKIDMNPAPGFAALSKGQLQLLLNAPGAGGAGATLADGSTPKPGGWNRFQIEVEDLEGIVSDLRRSGARFRNGIIAGKGGKQALLEDPAGNLIELFESNGSSA